MFPPFFPFTKRPPRGGWRLVTGCVAVLLLAGASGRVAWAQPPLVPAPTAPDEPSPGERRILFQTRFVELSLEDIWRLQQAKPHLSEPVRQLVDQLTALFDAAAPERKTSPNRSVIRVLPDKKLAALLRVFNQTKEFDLLSAPRLTCKSGQKATTEIEFEGTYPEVFERTLGADGQFVMTPPSYNPVYAWSLPGEVKQNDLDGARPRKQGYRNLGITLGVEGTVTPSQDAVDLNISLQSTCVDGFVRASDGQSLPALPQATGDLRTVFAKRSVDASLTVPPESTVVLGTLRQRSDDWYDKPDHPENARPVERVLVTFLTPSLVTFPLQSPLPTEEEEEVIVPAPVADRK